MMTLGVDRAHLYSVTRRLARRLGDRTPTAASADVWIRPRPSTIRPVWLVSLFVSATFIGGGLAAHQNWIADIPNATAVIVALPGLAAGYFASSEHRLTQQLLRGVLWSAVASAVASFGAAFTLIVEPASHSWPAPPAFSSLGAILVVAAVFFLPVLPREMIAARFKLPREGPIPDSERIALADAKTWRWLVAFFLVLGLLCIALDVRWLGQTPHDRYSPRTWLWVGFGSISVLATVYLTLAWLRALRNTRRPPTKEG